MVDRLGCHKPPPGRSTPITSLLTHVSPSKGGADSPLVATPSAKELKERRQVRSATSRHFDIGPAVTALATQAGKQHAGVFDLIFKCLEEYTAGIESLFNCLTANLPAVMDAAYCTLFFVDKAKSELSWVDAAGEARTHKLAISLVGYCATSGEYINLREVATDKRFNKNVDMDNSQSTKHIQSCLMIPLCTGAGTSLAVIELVNKKGAEFFDDEDLLTMRLVSRAVSPLIQRELAQRQLLQETKYTYVSHANDLLDFAMQISSENLELETVEQNILASAKDILGAERCSLFLVNEDTQQLESRVATGADKLTLPLQQGIAGAVATTGDIIICNEPYEDSRFDITMDSMTGFHTRNILCIPLKWDKKVIGVTQLINKVQGEFNTEDQETFKLFSNICSVAVHNCLLYKQATEAKNQADTLLKFLTKQMSASMYKEALTNVMITAKGLIKSDRCSLFVLDKKRKELRTRHADGLKEIRFPMKVGIAGQCVTTAKPLCVNDVSSNPHFYYAIDEQSKYKTTSVLAVPIIDTRGHVVAVAELINKLQGNFTQADLDVLTAFGTMAGKYLSWEEVGPILLDNPTPEILEKHCKPPLATQEAIKTWNFSPWSYSTEDLIGLIVYMFDSLSLIDEFNIPKEKLLKFVWSVARSYKKDVPYHTFHHAFDVTHAMFLYIMHGRIREKYLTTLDIFTLMISACCHDMNHQGYTNSFLEKANTPFGMLYKNGAIMEHHHISIMLSILSDSAHNIFEGLTEAQSRETWQDIISVILATDASHHMTQMSRFKDEFAEHRGGYDAKKKKHRRLLMAMLISWADTSNIVRPFKLAHKWAKLIAQEFFAEGDTEKSLGITPPAIFDREKMALSDMQIGFIRNVGIPSYTLLKNFLPALGGCLKQLQENLHQWENVPDDRPESRGSDTGDELVLTDSVDEY